MKYFLTILTVALQLVAFSQWADNTIDTTKYYKVVKFLNPMDGLIMGDQSTILKTADGGDSWTFISCPINISIIDFQYINETLIYAYGDDKIIKSDDHGNTWTHLNTLPFSFSKIYFINPSTGFLCNLEGIHKSTDAGLSWENVWSYTVGQYGFGSIFDIKPLNDSVGFACGVKHISGGGMFGIVLKTTDAGENWFEVYNNAPWGDAFSKIEIVNNTVYCIKNGSTFLKSTDLGSSWNEITTNLGSGGINSLFFKNNDTAYIASTCLYVTPEFSYSKRKIFRTTDACQTWITQYIEASYIIENELLNSICFSNDSTGFAVGYHKILRTNNYGGNTHIIDTIFYSGIEPNIPGNNFSFLIFPNPTENHIHIVSNNNDIFDIELFNSTGQRKYKSTRLHSKHTIDLTKFDKGIFLVKVTNGKSTKTEKVIKR